MRLCFRFVVFRTGLKVKKLSMEFQLLVKINILKNKDFSQML